MRWSSLFCDLKDEKDENGNLTVQKYVSLGRISFWLTFALMTRFWWLGLTVPGSLYDVFFIMVLYNFFKKPIEKINPEKLTNLLKRN